MQVIIGFYSLVLRLCGLVALSRKEYSFESIVIRALRLIVRTVHYNETVLKRKREVSIALIPFLRTQPLSQSAEAIEEYLGDPNGANLHFPNGYLRNQILDPLAREGRIHCTRSPDGEALYYCHPLSSDTDSHSHSLQTTGEDSAL